MRGEEGGRKKEGKREGVREEGRKEEGEKDRVACKLGDS